MSRVMIYVNLFIEVRDLTSISMKQVKTILAQGGISGSKGITVILTYFLISLGKNNELKAQVMRVINPK